MGETDGREKMTNAMFPDTPNALRIIQRVLSDPELSAFMNTMVAVWREDGDKRVAAERERCAKIADTAFDHMSPVAIYESYNADGKRVTRLNVDASARALAAEIRKDRGCDPPQAKAPCAFCFSESCDGRDCDARRAFIARNDNPPQAEPKFSNRELLQFIEQLYSLHGHGGANDEAEWWGAREWLIDAARATRNPPQVETK